MNLDNVIEHTAEPDVTSIRLQNLLENKKAVKIINTFSNAQQIALVQVISISRFLYNFMLLNPDTISLIGQPFQSQVLDETYDFHALRQYKYRSLLQITWNPSGKPVTLSP